MDDLSNGSKLLYADDHEAASALIEKVFEVLDQSRETGELDVHWNLAKELDYAAPEQPDPATTSLTV